MKVLARYLIVSALASAAFAATVEIRAQGAAPAQAAPPAPVAATPTTPSIEALFADAVAKEAAVRKALATRNPADTLLKAVRTVVDDYESFARHYPSSAPADDALWRGASWLQMRLPSFTTRRNRRPQSVCSAHLARSIPAAGSPSRRARNCLH
jgi:hypothetical protein